MLYSKEIDKRCEICMLGKKINDSEAICAKHGIVSLGYKCRRFKYDATKRIPSDNTSADFLVFNEKDFSLEK